MELKIKSVKNFKVYVRNEKEFKRIYREIFTNEEYKFSSDKGSPFIIDCGSHIGLSILYFKYLYPKAIILGFEPNPENFKILQKNIKENNLSNVKVVNAALSNKAGTTDLHVSLKKKSPWTWGDTIIYDMWGDKDNDRKVKCKTVKLSAFINKKVEFLKMDIEGSEQMVIEEIKDKLRFIHKMVIEFHGTKTNKKINNLNKILDILKDSGFKATTRSKSMKMVFPDKLWEYSLGSWVGTIKVIR